MTKFDITEYTLTDHDLAARWGKKLSTIRCLRTRKKSPPYLKLHATVRYRLADIEAFEQSCLRNVVA